MNKQEAVREATAKWLYDSRNSWDTQALSWGNLKVNPHYDDLVDSYHKHADALLAIQSSLGVCIQVEGELPLPRSPISIDPHPDYYVAQQDMLAAGYVQVIPLTGKEEGK